MDILYRWDEAKNAKLIRERGVSFEEAVLCIEEDRILETIDHPNKQRYPAQRIFVLKIRDYIYLIPHVDKGNEIILKTIISSRKWTRKYLEGGIA